MSAVEVPTTSEPEPEPAAAEEGETSSVGAGRKVMILGGDGFVGWPTATHLSALGYEVAIVDNCSRRTIDVELGTSSAIPIAGPEERVAAWERVSGKKIAFINCDVAKDFAGLIQCIAEFQPATICHFAEQRSAPYSMLSTTTKQYTVNNNVSATHNVLLAICEVDDNIHLVHMGTMGVYGYGSLPGSTIPEGYMDVEYEGKPLKIVHPYHPGSIYHTTKCLDNTLFHFYAKNNRISITDLHQGIIWGCNTDQTQKDPALYNRFDVDGEYGTVLNRFAAQVVCGEPLSVYGTGGQTRAFIHIQDSVRCSALAIQNPPPRGAQVEMFNQTVQTKCLRELVALFIAVEPSTTVNNVDNPRKEVAENTLLVAGADERPGKFKDLGLADTKKINEESVRELLDTMRSYKDTMDVATFKSNAKW